MLDFLKEILSGEDFEKFAVLIEENYVQKTAMDEKIKEIEDGFSKNKLDFMLEAGLKNSGAKNLVAVKALLDGDKISLDENGDLIGFDEQIKALQKSQDFLFEKAEVKGLDLAEKTEETEVDPNKMGYEELCSYFKK